MGTFQSAERDMPASPRDATEKPQTEHGTTNSGGFSEHEDEHEDEDALIERLHFSCPPIFELTTWAEFCPLLPLGPFRFSFRRLQYWTRNSYLTGELESIWQILIVASDCFTETGRQELAVIRATPRNSTETTEWISQLILCFPQTLCSIVGEYYGAYQLKVHIDTPPNSKLASVSSLWLFPHQGLFYDSELTLLRPQAIVEALQLLQQAPESTFTLLATLPDLIQRVDERERKANQEGRIVLLWAVRKDGGGRKAGVRIQVAGRVKKAGFAPFRLEGIGWLGQQPVLCDLEECQLIQL